LRSSRLCGEILSLLKIIAHRGASARTPENTLAAVRVAAELGADGVEVDVRLTRDNQLAVLHDTDTRRVAPNQAVFTAKRRRLSELQSLDVGSWKDPKFSRERVPALGEVLAALGPQQEIFIELKSREYDEILAKLDRLLTPQTPAGFPAARVVLMSFDGNLMRKFKKARPSWRVLLLLNHKPAKQAFDRLVSSIRAKHINGIGQNRTWALAKDEYEALREAGAILSVWTVDDPRETEKWRGFGFDYLTSNVPEKMKRAVASDAPTPTVSS
jgi:glycerophosphoryl diester phosphodiesterase